MRQFEDSDEEDDEDGDELVVDTDKEKPQVHVPTTETTKEVTEAGGSSSETYDMDFSADMAEYHYLNRNTVNEDEAPRHVRPKSSHPCTPRTAPSSVEPDRRGSPPNLPVPGPAKTQVIVRDAAYATYRAVLYYVSFPSRHGITQTEALLMNTLPQIYTDTITFAPLSSTFLASAATTPNTVAPAPGTPSSESQASAFTQRPNHQKAESATTIGSVPPRSRREWIAQWERNNATGKPRPCSAKAVYRLSDSAYYYYGAHRTCSALTRACRARSAGPEAACVPAHRPVPHGRQRRVRGVLHVLRRVRGRAQGDRFACDRRTGSGILTHCGFSARSCAGPGPLLP